MRLTSPSPFVIASQSDSQVALTGQRGELLRLTALDHDLIHVEHLPEGDYRQNRTWSIVAGEVDTPLTGRQRGDLTGYALPPVAGMSTTAGLRLSTDELEIDITLRTGALTWRDRASGQAFAADLPARPYVYDRAGRSIFHYKTLRAEDHFYGFGEQAGALDKRGLRMRLLNIDAIGYDAETSDPLYKHIPFYITYAADLDIAYGIFYDNLAATIFDLGHEVNGGLGNYHYYQADDGDLDYYLIYGKTIERVIERYTWLTGRPARLPRYALGYLGSTMSYTEAPDAQAQLARFAELCQLHDIPCDMFHLSSGYTTSATGKRYVFQWNHDRVPDPAAMVNHFHQAGIRVAPNIKPHLLQTHPSYAAIAAQDGFIRDGDSGAPAINQFWSGGMNEVDAGSLLDFTNPTTFAWWKAQIKSALLAYGMDALWNDNNEFELWDDDAVCAGFGQSFRLGLGGRGLQTLLMGRASAEALKEHNPDRLPFVLTRSGVPGIQRYAQTWSGDNTTSWKTLRWNLPMGLGLGLCGVPNNGHDIGGFAGAAPTPELFVRWVQVGVFFPRFTIHSWNSDGTVNEPWMYPEVLPHIRTAIKLRYQLLPTLEALMEEAAATGHPIMRPLVYHFADDPRCRTESFDFMLGANLLIAPVLEEGVPAREVYLPKGAHNALWVDFYTGATYEGGQVIRVATPIDHIPVFVRAGASISFWINDHLEQRVFSPT